MTQQEQPTLTEEELQTLEALLVKVSGRGGDLPWPLFRFITEVTATTNVDLLVRDPARGVLLAWRDDPFGTGWHVPGSIIRHREEVTHRIAACAMDNPAISAGSRYCLPLSIPVTPSTVTRCAHWLAANEVRVSGCLRSTPGHVMLRRHRRMARLLPIHRWIDFLRNLITQPRQAP